MSYEVCVKCSKKAEQKCMCNESPRFYCLSHFLTHMDSSPAIYSLLSFDISRIPELEKSLVTLYNYKLNTISLSQDAENFKGTLSNLLTHYFSQKSKAFKSLISLIDSEIQDIEDLRNSFLSEKESEYSIPSGIHSNFEALSSINLTTLFKEMQDSVNLYSPKLMKANIDTGDDKSNIISVLCSQLKIQVDKAFAAETKLNRLKDEMQDKEEEIRSLEADNKMKDEITQIYVKKVLENDKAIDDLKTQVASLKNQLEVKDDDISRYKNAISFLNSAGSSTIYLESQMSYINSIALTSDDTRLVTGGEDCMIRVWTLSSLTQEIELAGHTAAIKSVFVSKDIKYIASGGEDMTIRLWNMTTREQEAIFDGHSSTVWCVSISGNGVFLASGGGVNDAKIRIWNIEHRRQDAVLEGHTDKVMCIAICREDNYIVSGAGLEDRSIRIWNIAQKTCEAVLTGHKAAVYSLSVSLDGSYIVSGSGYSENAIRVWDFEEKRLKNVLKGHTGAVLSVGISSDGKYCVSGSYDRSVKVWNISTYSEVLTYSGHADKVWSVAITHDSKKILSSSYDNTIKIWSFINVNTF
jgi:WD40 repeat protein